MAELNENNLKVNCYSGYTYAERPESFFWQGIKYEVEQVKKSWHEPRKKYFTVCTTDNKIFELCYNEVESYWTLTKLTRS